MMNSPTLYLLAADGVLALHVLFVAFVLLGLLMILVGKVRGWSWVRNPWFRATHLAAIGVVTLQTWLGLLCPLTTLENWLRTSAGDAPYARTFISHFLEKILYYRAPEWVFVVCYTIFALLVVASWIRIRPHPFSTRKKSKDS